MTITKTDIQSFISLARKHPVFDVRSPSEFAHAHIPGAFSLPIFDDEQRKEIGTAYKQISRQHAIKLGLTHFGTKLNQYVEQVEEMLSQLHITDKKIAIHCWRGGMRSSAMTWLLSFYGFDVMLLVGGYKAYRNYVLAQFELPFQFKVLGGYTGSGKTAVLQRLKQSGEAVIDLEHIAHHRGSAFGALGQPAQPTQEQFENNLVAALSEYYEWSPNLTFYQPKPIWIESESQRIGLVNLTPAFFDRLSSAQLFTLTIPFEQRLEYIMLQYGAFQKQDLIHAVLRIQKRLGGLDTKLAVQALHENDIRTAFTILLKYYDREYNKSRERNKRSSITVTAETIDAEMNAQKLCNQENIS